MRIRAHEHEHSHPRTRVLLTDYLGHKCPKPRVRLPDAWIDFFLPSVADAVVLFFCNNVRDAGLLHRLRMYLTTYLYGHYLSMMLFASKYTLVPVVCGHLSFGFISSFSALHIASSTCGSKMDGS